MTSATIDWRSAPPFTINRHTEYPVNCIFAAAKPINWFAKGVDPSTQCRQLTPTEFPPKWQESPAQPILSRPVAELPKAPWFYGETPDLVRLVGNAAKGHGS